MYRKRLSLTTHLTTHQKKLLLIALGIFLSLAVSTILPPRWQLEIAQDLLQDQKSSGNLGYLAFEGQTNNTSSSASTTVIQDSAVSSSSSGDNRPLHQVVAVVDGDTVKVSINGALETVRIVGINTPETVDPRKGVECFGVEASAKLKSLLLGQMVTLTADPTQSDRDRYGRLLRFIEVSGTDVGLHMIEQGFAYEALYSSTPHRLHAEYVQAQKEAQEGKRGLWADDACGGGLE